MYPCQVSDLKKVISLNRQIMRWLKWINVRYHLAQTNITGGIVALYYSVKKERTFRDQVLREKEVLKASAIKKTKKKNIFFLLFDVQKNWSPDVLDVIVWNLTLPRQVGRIRRRQFLSHFCQEDIRHIRKLFTAFKICRFSLEILGHHLAVIAM